MDIVKRILTNIKSSMAALSKATCQRNKVIDLSGLPPCPNVLWVHSERTNFVAKIWRSALKNKIYKENLTFHGWDEYGNISGIFLNNLFNDKQYDFGSDNEESEDENKDKKSSSSLVTLDLVLNGSIIFGQT